MKTGYPRHDIIYSVNKASLIKKIKQELGLVHIKKFFICTNLEGE
ncbi:hypothetical protein [Bacillus halotolerans]